MPAPLVPCPFCHRHVRRFDSTCPFCDAPVPRDLVPVPGQTRRLSRAAVAVFASTIALGGCGGATEAPIDASAPADTAKDSVDDWGTMDAAYGLADTSLLDTGTDWGTFADAYGLPPDFGFDTGAADTGTDFGSEAGRYGGPPP